MDEIIRQLLRFAEDCDHTDGPEDDGFGTYVPGVTSGDFYDVLQAAAQALQSLAPAGWRDISEAPFADFDTTQPLDCLVWSPQIGGVRTGRVWRYADGQAYGQADGYMGDWDITHFCEKPLPPTPQPRTDAEEN